MIKSNNNVELLAPAGSYVSMIGAFNAGADAVYLGGEKFSARAFADNFTTEKLCEAIRYAHLFHKKIYLTLNTLIKESEFGELFDYMKPLYLAGLDAVIVQDMGVLLYLKEQFPYMELHASTQMAVTGSAFVDMCKELGISRVVPARELSLKELKEIKEAGIEVECFVHGAMCYCYSGMCLMSSVLGGRSGNRGKCAQPCRLAYEVDIERDKKRDIYTLSLKDMCTIEHIDKLIQAGMDSFKIEGRMKRSEYAALATSLYRKYIDIYLANPSQKISINAKDKKTLEQVYLRSELSDGYLFRQNGEEMVTKQKPSYNPVDERLLAGISEKYLNHTMKKKISIYAYFQTNEEAMLTVVTEEGESVTITGPMVEAATKTAATVETIRKQLEKIGNTHFILEDVNIDLVGDNFLPVSVLNAMRREAIEKLESDIIRNFLPELDKRICEEDLKNIYSKNTQIKENEGNTKNINKLEITKANIEQKLEILATDMEQLLVISRHDILNKTKIVFIEEALIYELIDNKTLLEELLSKVKLGIVLPDVIRNKDNKELIKLLDLVREIKIGDVLINNIEALAIIHKYRDFKFNITTNCGLYIWNRYAQKLYLKYANQVSLPIELNQREKANLKSPLATQLVYGYIPLMISANCAYKTNKGCLKSGGDDLKVKLIDRYQKAFVTKMYCKYCYNVIYNSVPLSLHNKIKPNDLSDFRMQFTLESAKNTKEVLDFYNAFMEGKKADFPIKEFTTVHENRQVE